MLDAPASLSSTPLIHATVVPYMHSQKPICMEIQFTRLSLCIVNPALTLSAVLSAVHQGPVNHFPMLWVGGPIAQPVSSRFLLSITPLMSNQSRGQLSCCSKCRNLLGVTLLTFTYVVLSKISLWMLFLQDPFCADLDPEGVWALVQRSEWQGRRLQNSIPSSSPPRLWSQALSGGVQQWQCLGKEGRKAEMEKQGERIWINAWKKKRESEKMTQHIVKSLLNLPSTQRKTICSPRQIKLPMKSCWIRGIVFHKLLHRQKNILTF